LQGDGVTRNRITATRDVQHRHVHAAGSRIDGVNEDLEKTYDRDICFVTADGERIRTVKDRKGNDGITARDHTSTDVQGITRSRFDLVRVRADVERILPCGLMDKTFRGGKSIKGRSDRVFIKIYLIRTCQSRMLHSALVGRGLIASGNRLLVGIGIAATWHSYRRSQDLTGDVL